MARQLIHSLALLLLCAPVFGTWQSDEAPFAVFDKAVKQEGGGWAGDKHHLSTVFDVERNRLGDRFEIELLKWLGNDPERHYWISSFLESRSYLHGNKRLPHLSLLIKQQGLALVQGKDDKKSRGYVVRLNITAAILSDELGFTSLASFYKNEAERLLLRQPELDVFIPGGSEADRRRYQDIKSIVSRNIPAVIVDTNLPPATKVSGGLLNGRALNKVTPVYPIAARQAGASGTVEVRVVFDETGKVIWARAISGHSGLRQVAEEAAWQTRFPPTMLSGQPVRTSGVMLYNFVP